MIWDIVNNLKIKTMSHNLQMYPKLTIFFGGGKGGGVASCSPCLYTFAGVQQHFQPLPAALYPLLSAVSIWS